MNYGVDTNVLVRTVQPLHDDYQVAIGAISRLHTSGHFPSITPQNVIEFWAVATRPISARGLGFSYEFAQQELLQLRKVTQILNDSNLAFAVRQTLLEKYQFAGKVAHDAKLTATLLANRITHILTFNDRDFRRFTEITVLTPAEVVAASASIE